MEKKIYELLKNINAQCGTSYKVLSLKSLGETDASEMLDYLSVRGYVSVRYKDADSVCLCSMPKGINYELPEVKSCESEKTDKSFIPFYIIFIVAFTGSFLGGALIEIILKFFAK